MPALKTYDLFIIHAWNYGDDYDKLVGLLNNAKWFNWRNYSVPQNRPLDDRTHIKLKKELDEQIRPVNLVLIISGMYVNHREWIQYEIDVAKRYNKPIIGVIPRGKQRTPTEVKSEAKVMVKWSTKSIVKAIRDYAI